MTAIGNWFRSVQRCNTWDCDLSFTQGEGYYYGYTAYPCINDAYGLVPGTGTSTGGFTIGADFTTPTGTLYDYGIGSSGSANLPLILMGHREYDPVTGRFLTRDPIGYAGGINQYAYADDNPVGGVDPEGLSPDGTGTVTVTHNGMIIIRNGALQVDTDGNTDYDTSRVFVPTHQDDTSMMYDGNYLDAKTIPYAVYYVNGKGNNHGITKGDYGILIYNGNTQPVVFGDTGWSLAGEASIAAHKGLGRNPQTPCGNWGNGLPENSGVEVLAFPGSHKLYKGPITPAGINNSAWSAYGNYIGKSGIPPYLARW